jgi:hypothetical protein
MSPVVVASAEKVGLPGLEVATANSGDPAEPTMDKVAHGDEVPIPTVPKLVMSNNVDVRLVAVVEETWKISLFVSPGESETANLAVGVVVPMPTAPTKVEVAVDVAMMIPTVGLEVAAIPEPEVQ